MISDLLDRIRQRRHGIRLYGLTPPKRGQDPDKVRAIAERQAARIADLAPDGLILYDLQDEAGRTGVERPFPFLPTLEPGDYAREYLSGLGIPRILYKCVANMGSEEFLSWRDGLDSGRDACVLVGAPASKPAPGHPAAGAPAAGQGLPLPEAYALLAQGARPVCVGGVAIAERPARKGDEEARLLSKHAAGCRFFVSQTIFDSGATKSLLSDYALRFAREGLEPAPFILSFSPCGSLKTMEFMQWLGISFPRWLANDLRHSPDILAKSVELAAQVFAEIRDYAAEKRVPIGINVESVSIRKEEIEASGELYRRLSAALA
jgi:hypothetical protein